MNTQLKDLFPFCCQAINESKQKQFEALLSQRVSNTINAHSLLRRLSYIKSFKDDSKFKFNSKNKIKFILPKLGHVPLHIEDAISDELYVNCLTIGSTLDVNITSVESDRFDLLEIEIASYVKNIINYEEDCFFRLLIPAATFKVDSPPSAFLKFKNFSEEVIISLVTEFEKDEKILTHILISEEDRADLEKQYSKVLGKYIISSSVPFDLPLKVNNKNYTIKLITHKQLGKLGKYNINTNKSKFGTFRVGEHGNFNNYKITKGNKVIIKYNKSEEESEEIIKCTRRGETQIYGLSIDKSEEINAPFKLGIKQEMTLYSDPVLHRTHRLGYYGWEEIGVALTDPDCVKMVVIDRS